VHMIRYTIRPECVEENERLVRAIVDELHDVQPAGLRYAAFKLDDGASFVHLVSRDASAGHLPGRQLDALRAFHAGLRERCVAPPERAELASIGEFPRGAALQSALVS
jgi:hypothetical protein